MDLLLALGVPTEVAEADAEGIEHHVSEATLKAFAHFLETPGTDVGPESVKTDDKRAGLHRSPHDPFAPCFMLRAELTR